MLAASNDYALKGFESEAIFFKSNHKELGKMLDKALEAQRRAKVPNAQLEKMSAEVIDKYND